MSFASNLLLRKANRLFDAGKIKEAGEVLSHAIGRGENDPRLWLRKGILQRSIPDLNECLKINPSNRAADFLIALFAYSNNDFDYARQSAEQALIKSPKNSSAKILLDLIELRKKEDLLPLAAKQKDVIAANVKAQALALIEVEKSINTLDSADTGSHEKEAALGWPLGWILDRLDDVAVWLYWLFSFFGGLIKSLAGKRQMAVFNHVSKGERLAGLRQYDQAAKEFEKAIALDPNNKDALNALAGYHIEQDDYKCADTYLSRLENIEATTGSYDPYIKRWRADILFSEGNYEKAGQAYDEVDADFHFSYIIPYKRGLCMLRLGDEAGAQKHFVKALSRPNPDLILERFEKLSELAG